MSPWIATILLLKALHEFVPLLHLVVVPQAHTLNWHRHSVSTPYTYNIIIWH